MKRDERGDIKNVKDDLNEVGKKDEYGETALMKAACSGHVEYIPFLEGEIGIQDEGGWTALMRAAYNDQIECISLLAKEMGMQTNDGWTALMFAALLGHTDCVRLLLSEVGKQSTQECNDFPPGMTALMIAAYWNHHEIVQLLLPYERGLKDSEGRMAHWYANNSPWKKCDFPQVCELLEDEDSLGKAIYRSIAHLSFSKSQWGEDYPNYQLQGLNTF